MTRTAIEFYSVKHFILKNAVATPIITYAGNTTAVYFILFYAVFCIVVYAGRTL